MAYTYSRKLYYAFGKIFVKLGAFYENLPDFTEKCGQFMYFNVKLRKHKNDHCLYGCFYNSTEYSR